MEAWARRLGDEFESGTDRCFERWGFEILEEDI